MTNDKRTYEAAWRVFCDRYSNCDGEFILTELLKNRMQFDGHDYSDYLPDDEGFTPDYDGALIILNSIWLSKRAQARLLEIAYRHWWWQAERKKDYEKKNTVLAL